MIKDSRNLIFAFGGEYTNAFSIKKLAGKPAFFASITMRKRQVLRKVLTKIDPVRYDFSKRSSLNFPFTGIFKIDIIIHLIISNDAVCVNKRSAERFAQASHLKESER